MPDSHEFPNDDDAIDKALRIAELQAELAQLTGEALHPHLAEDDEIDPADSWKAGLDAIEADHSMPLYDILQLRRKFIPKPLARIQGSIDLLENLWLLLYALASIRIFIEETDHLSDAELYALLLNKLLPQNSTLLPINSNWNCRYSICDICDEHDPRQTCYLRYYADESMRAEIAHEYPGSPLPPKEEPPYDRDAFLPSF
ncbi:MAG: hypothetical protein EA353_03510 [Puniceicoccaceae bacterium]|nr:MAG: hypothetical protein EA353_03510 [Puniceicoccaceae bacterium]